MISRFLYSFCLLCFGILVFNTEARAQQKIGYVNTDIILNEIPEYEGIQQQLRVVSEQWRADLEKMQEEINQLEEDFEANEILYTDDVRRKKEQKIEQKKQARKEYLEQKFGPEGEYFQKQQELLKPIQRNIYEAITAVARRGNYDFIFDRAQNASLLFGEKQWNLNQNVLQELGVSLDN